MPLISLHQTTRITKETPFEGLSLTTIEQRGVRELHITIVPQPGEPFSQMIERLHAVLKQNDAEVVKQQIFAATDLRKKCIPLMNEVFGNVRWPITWIEGASCAGDGIAGMHVQAISGALVETVAFNGAILGCAFSDGWARHLVLGGLAPDDNSCSEAAQTGQVYDQLQAVLRENDMGLGNVIRTWFFLEDILDWYGDFNAVRNCIYSRECSRFFPASTGVGVRNGFGNALSVEAWAMQALDGHVKVSEVKSPLQCAAPRYGSGFSRAVEIATPGLRRLLISGTASIDSTGVSLYEDSVANQIQETMDVVTAILHSRRQNFDDVTRATAYLKRPDDAVHFVKWCEANQVEIPVIITQAEVCRDELLFEIELDAITTPSS